MLNTLLTTGAGETPRGPGKSADERKSLDTGKSKDERQAEEESKAQPISKPGGFKNDPPDPTNPNEVRERTLKKQKR